MASWHDSKAWRDARTKAKLILEAVCAVCHKELIGSDWTIDHIQPPAATGGEPDHSIDNLQSLCRSCNGRKQDKTLERITWLNPRWHN